MGHEVTCGVRVNGQVATARVLLETRELRVRRPMPMVIPFAAVSMAEVDGQWLHVRHAAGDAWFDLGPAVAARWADRIRNPRTRLQKIGVRPGQRVAVLGDPDDTLVSEIEGAGASVIRRLPAGGSLDAVFLAVTDRRGLARVPAAAAALADDGALWIVRPKGTPAITDAETRAAGRAAALVDVKVVSFSDTRTAEKFVMPVARRHRRDSGQG